MYHIILWWQIMAISCTVIVTSLEIQSVNQTCETEGQTLTCDHNLPHLIPKQITEVYIVNYRHHTITEQNHAFDDPSWNSVKKLDLTIFSSTKYYIYDNDFDSLKRIRILGIHSNTLAGIGEYGLSGLEQLVHLDLAGCKQLASDAIVVPLLINNSTPHLKSLDLGRLQSKNTKQFKLSENFVKMIKMKNIKSLSLSGTDILVQDRSVFYIENSLQYLDVSDITYFDTDHSSSTSKAILERPFFRNIKTLNLSNNFKRVFGTEIGDLLSIEYMCHRKKSYLESLNTLDISYNNFGISIIKNINMSCSTIHLKHLYLQGNGIKTLNATIFWPKSAQLVKVNLSQNKLTYLSPSVFYKQNSIKMLNLSNNCLFQMEKYPEFEKLLGSFSHLEHFSIAYNRLTRVPYRMFQNNTRLQVIILKGNHLSSVNFKIRHLIGLKRLDLQNNRIIYLDESGLGELKYTLQTTKTGISTSTVIHFHHNPLQCSCKSLDFIIWLESMVSPLTREKLQCDLEGDHIEINNVAVDRTKYLCHRTVIIATVCTGVMVLLAIVISIVLVMKQNIRKRYRNNIIVRLLNDFKKGRLDEKHLLFLSYCNDDGEFVLKYIFKKLDITLKDVSRLNKTQLPVCSHGDINFTPGRPILTEIMRCVSESCVIVFVVSRAFCASDWCRMEIKEAYEQDKPIILIFKENVDERMMPSYLLNIFKRHVRVKLIQIDGQYELEPSWTSLCESILLLASEKEHHKRQDKLNMERNRDIDPPVQEPFLAGQN